MICCFPSKHTTLFNCRRPFFLSPLLLFWGYTSPPQASNRKMHPRNVQDRCLWNGSPPCGHCLSTLPSPETLLSRTGRCVYQGKYSWQSALSPPPATQTHQCTFINAHCGLVKVAVHFHPNKYFRYVVIKQHIWKYHVYSNLAAVSS